MINASSCHPLLGFRRLNARICWSQLAHLRLFIRLDESARLPVDRNEFVPQPSPAHFAVAPDSVRWEASLAGMFRGAAPTDTASVWRYAGLEGDPLKPGAPYTVEFGSSDGSKAGAHWHPNDTWRRRSSHN